MAKPERTVLIRVTIPATQKTIPNATVRVRLQDVTLLDASAIDVDAVSLDNVAHAFGSPSVFEVRLRLPTCDVRKLAASAHVDVDRDGQLSRGDLFNTESCPIDCDSCVAELTLQRV